MRLPDSLFTSEATERFYGFTTRAAFDGEQSPEVNTILQLMENEQFEKECKRISEELFRVRRHLRMLEQLEAAAKREVKKRLT